MSVRFAPSPTGTFHVGNLRTAWISHAFARGLGMPWVVRFEDIDGPRVAAGAMEKQLSDMEAIGLTPDRVLIQSTFHARHERLFREAIEKEQVYPCTCSRKEILQDLQRMASAPHESPAIYNGRCRDPEKRQPSSHPTLAWRFRNSEDPSGAQDFIVGRTDPQGGAFAPAYHWSCAIDDYEGEHALLVRASDLSSATPLQKQVHQWAGKHEGVARPYPAVFHAALVQANDGSRLEKRTRGVTLAELIAAGISAEDLARRFELSFESTWISRFTAGAIAGEKPEVIRLGALGL